MEVIREHVGKRKGEKSLTVHILRQGEPEPSKTITVAGELSIEELHQKLLFYLKSLELADDKPIKILIGE